MRPPAGGRQYIYRHPPIRPHLRLLVFGGDYGKDTGSYVTAVKDAIAAIVAAIPEITIKDETNEFDNEEFKDEWNDP